MNVLNISADNQIAAQIIAGDGAAVTDAGTFVGSAIAGSGSLTLIADGSVLLNSATANGNLLVASSGSVATAGGGSGASIVAPNVQIIAGGRIRSTEWNRKYRDLLPTCEVR